MRLRRVVSQKVSVGTGSSSLHVGSCRAEVFVDEVLRLLCDPAELLRGVASRNLGGIGKLTFSSRLSKALHGLDGATGVAVDDLVECLCPWRGTLVATPRCQRLRHVQGLGNGWLLCGHVFSELVDCGARLLLAFWLEVIDRLADVLVDFQQFPELLLESIGVAADQLLGGFGSSSIRLDQGLDVQSAELLAGCPQLEQARPVAKTGEDEIVLAQGGVLSALVGASLAVNQLAGEAELVLRLSGPSADRQVCFGRRAEALLLRPPGQGHELPAGAALHVEASGCWPLAVLPQAHISVDVLDFLDDWPVVVR